MTRQEAVGLWDAFTAQHVGDIPLDAVADFIVGVARNERRICINVAEAHVQCECCAALVDALNEGFKF